METNEAIRILHEYILFGEDNAVVEFEATHREFEEAIELAINALKQQKESATGVLCTIYETPESCPNCFEHLSLDWSYCPECGKLTPWSKQ